MRFSRVMLVMVALQLLRCGSNTPQSGGESHFLASCQQSSNCAQGLICACGVCTRTCASAGDCASLSTAAVCLDVAPICASAGRLCGELGDASLAAGGRANTGGKTSTGGSDAASGVGSGGFAGAKDAGVDASVNGSGGSSGGSTAGSGGAPGADSGGSSDAASSGGARGNKGDGGDIVQDAGTRPHGHVVLIGSWYAQHTPDDERVLENSVFLGGGKSAVRVLEFVQFVKNATGGYEPDVHPFLSSRATAIGRSVTFTELNDYRWLDAELRASMSCSSTTKRCCTTRTRRPLRRASHKASRTRGIRPSPHSSGKVGT